MFGFFSKKAKAPEIAYDQAVIVEIDFAGLDDFGTKNDQETVKQIETEIENCLTAPDGVDGDEFGEGGAAIYIYGKDANHIFREAEPILRNSKFNHITITLLYGPADDPDTKEKKFSL